MTLILKQTEFYKIQHKGATARLAIYSNGTAHISGVYSRYRGRGEARLLMQGLCEFLDLNGWPAQLEVSNYGPNIDSALTNDQLVAFYQKFGFVVVTDDASPTLMRRSPGIRLVSQDLHIL